MPRPAKPVAERLDARLTIRLSKDTLTLWQDAARGADLKVGEWLRTQTDPGPPARRLRPPQPADPKLLAAIARVGNNLNQLARAANRNEWPEPIRLLERLIGLERALKSLLPTPPDDD